MQTHGVAFSEVYKSIWKILDTINAYKKLTIKFPNHNEQKIIAEGFKMKLWVKFINCTGCINGMLVWTNKPNKKTLEQCDIGPKKFYCGRKKKFGVTLQAVCDHKRRFIDIEIGFPALSSDYLCFVNSTICKLMYDSNLLAPGLCLYGDAAYGNNMFMTVPFKNVSFGPKDAFNFFHSQIRINIECAFGMLVHRWPVLRKPIPVNISIQRTTHLVRALCMLHNFCINQHEIKVPHSTNEDLLSVAL